MLLQVKTRTYKTETGENSYQYLCVESDILGEVRLTVDTKDFEAKRKFVELLVREIEKGGQ